LPKWGISGQKLSTYHKSTIEAKTLMLALMPPFWQTPVISSLSFSQLVTFKNNNMSREIKFEYGFQSQNGIVKKVYDLAQIPRIAQICDVWNDLPIVYVRQATEEKGVNGIEIYNGDVVRLREAERKYVVKFYKGCFKLFHADPKLNDMLWGTIERVEELLWTIEVIGNIYENPELLSEQS
jgi:hypothetical protein